MNLTLGSFKRPALVGVLAFLIAMVLMRQAMEVGQAGILGLAIFAADWIAGQWW